MNPSRSKREHGEIHNEGTENEPQTTTAGVCLLHPEMNRRLKTIEDKLDNNSTVLNDIKESLAAKEAVSSYSDKWKDKLYSFGSSIGLLLTGF